MGFFFNRFCHFSLYVYVLLPELRSCFRVFYVVCKRQLRSFLYSVDIMLHYPTYVLPSSGNPANWRRKNLKMWLKNTELVPRTVWALRSYQHQGGQLIMDVEDIPWTSSSTNRTHTIRREIMLQVKYICRLTFAGEVVKCYRLFMALYNYAFKTYKVKIRELNIKKTIFKSFLFSVLVDVAACP